LPTECLLGDQVLGDQVLAVLPAIAALGKN
jgi:hypothetical protein